MHVKLTCKYLGTKFHGFAAQNRARTVQGELEAALSKYFGQTIKTVGAGRTDAGVHAEGQVVSFLLPSKSEKTFDAKEFVFEVNNLLPKDISVRDAELKEKFNARQAAKSKTYIYKCYVGSRRDTSREETQFWLKNRPDISAMRKAAAELVGTHDFTKFCVDRDGKNPVRTVSDFTVEERGDEIWFTIRGENFLKKQVRMMVGYLLNPAEVTAVPAKGLTLYCIEF